jgi:protein-tyrosine phosphatase
MRIKRLRLSLLVGLLVALLGAWLWLVWLAGSYEEVPYSLIEQGLYLGPYVSNPPPKTRAVVNLGEEKDPYQVENCLWEPIRDAPPAPRIEWLQRTVEFIAAQRQEGLTVYVHCTAGISRSGMVSAAYLMYEHSWSRDEALRFVRQKRPQVRPNSAFMQLLTEWEQVLREPATVGGG